MLSWPSPVDGRTLMVQGSLCSDDFRFAYRLADVAHGLVCYPIVSHHHSTTLGLYVPALDIVIVRNGWAAGWLDIYVSNVTDWLVPLVCRYGGVLESYFRVGASRVGSIMRDWQSTHLGHQLWNELTGIDWFLRLASGPILPEWIVPGPFTEVWGPIDEVFPQIQGRVDRSAPHAEAAILSSYWLGVCLVRITSEYISVGLRAALRRKVEADPAYDEVCKVVANRTRPNAPILLLGLRVENRTMVDLLEFCEELLEFVAEKFPGAIIVLDGHNAGRNGQTIGSHGELLARRPPLEVEREIAVHLRRLQVGRDVTVLDTLGSSIWTSLAWCGQADCFFSVWGASLAKYRWACNKSGLVVTSNWNMAHRGDLHIYDSPLFMDDSSDLSFVPGHLIQDIPSATLLVDVGPGQPSFFNFTIDPEFVFPRLLTVILDATRSSQTGQYSPNYSEC